MSEINQKVARQAVQERYGEIATSESAGCGGPSGCCGGGAAQSLEESTANLGYSPEDLATLPEGANLGLGCGNPQALASLLEGETVVDLGSGAGIDCLLAARRVGPSGRVIGIDMTTAMLEKARSHADQAKAGNVEFRLGEIEHLPVGDGQVDVIISNCVINLSTDKPQVFREAYRVLRQGGRLAIWDTVALTQLPDEIKQDLDLYTSCLAGATPRDELQAMLVGAGFKDVRITPADLSKTFIEDWAPGHRIEDYVVSAAIEAVK
ncbi:MAG TPA: arsenite methyltransferase [Acidiferrobacteraceae bacterium]|nr:arsenite methyltransferase [Acidiferrobacteraceae bacterium]